MTYINKWIKISVLINLVPFMAFSQNVTGEINPIVGSNYNYTYMGGMIVEGWSVTSRGTVINSSGNGATIRWNDAGSGTVTVDLRFSADETLNVNAQNPIPPPSAPTTTDDSFCGPYKPVLTASSNSSVTFRWYSIGGSLLKTSTGTTSTYSPVASISTTTNYTVSASNAGGTSSQSQTTGHVFAIPGIPGGSNKSRCGTGSLALTASVGSNGNQVKWFTSSTAASNHTPVTYTGTSYSKTYSSYGTTTYYLKTYHSSTGCWSGSTKTITATIKKIPNASASNRTICSGSSTNVSISNPNSTSGTTYSWTAAPQSGISGASGGSGSLINQTLTNSSSSRKYVTYIITPSANGCSGSSITVSVYVDPSSIGGTASVNITQICGSGSVNLSLTGQRGTLQHWKRRTYENGTWGGWINIGNGATNSLGAVTSEKRYHYRAVLRSGACSNSYSSTSSTVYHYPALDAGYVTVSGNPTNTCSGVNLILNVNGNNAPVKKWMTHWKDGEGGWSSESVISTSTGSPGYTVVNLITNSVRTFEFWAVVDQDGCPEVASTKASITVDSHSVGGIVSSSKYTYCSNEQMTFSLDSHNGTVQHWFYRSRSLGGSWGSPQTVSITNSTIDRNHPNSTGQIKEYEYWAEVLNGPNCNLEESGRVVVSVYSELTAGTIGSNRNICEGEMTSILANQESPSGGISLIYQWQESNTGNEDDFTDLPSEMALEYQPSALTKTTWYRRVVTSGNSCGSLPTNAVKITVTTSPNAGTAFPIGACNSVDNFWLFAALQGQPYDNNGTWSHSGSIQLSGTQNEFFDVTQVLPGDYQFIYTITATGGCAGDSEIVYVTVDAAVNAGVGSTMNTCSSETSLVLSEGITGGTPGGTWRDSDNQALPGNVFNPSTTGGGIYTFTHTVFNGSCNDSEVVTVNVSQAPPKPSISASAPNPVCDNVILTSSVSPTGYQWFKDGVNIQGETGQNLFVQISGDYSVTIGEICKSPLSDPYSVVVGTRPDQKTTALIGPNQLCAGETTQLQVSNSQSGIEYRVIGDGGLLSGNILGNGGNISISTNPLINPLSGDINIEAIDPTTGCSTILNDSYSVIVNTRPAPPTTSINVQVFLGQSGQLQVSGGGPEFHWYDAQSELLVGVRAASYDNSFTQSETFSVYSYDTSISCESSGHITTTISVYSLPSITTSGDGTILIGETETLSVGTFDSYEWKKEGVSKSTSSTYNAKAPGEYEVNLTKVGASINVKIELNDPFPNLNYIITTTLKKEILDESIVNELSIEDRTVNVDYFGGLGRTIQQVSIQASPGKKDIVQLIAYDEFGRVTTSYLPYADASNDGRFKIDAFDSQAQFYQTQNDAVADDLFPSGLSVYDDSPLNRVVEQYGPGQNWRTNSRRSRFSYEANISADHVISWEVDTQISQMISKDTPAEYAPGELYKNTTTDEGGHQVQEFVNKTGQTILKRVEAPDSKWADTYYLYDDFGNLGAVLPPEASARFDAEFSTDPDKFTSAWMFIYKYDGRKRMVEKKVPGSGWVYMVYDKFDRLVLTQDAIQKEDLEWFFTKYDFLGRPLLTGIINIPGDRTSVQSQVNSFYDNVNAIRFETQSGAVHGYTNDTYPSVNATNCYTVMYYDNYEFLNDPNWDSEAALFAFESISGFSDNNFARVRGQVTGTKIKILGTNQWLKYVSYYDDKYRLIQAVGNNQKGGLDRSSNLHDFVGKLIINQITHTTSDGMDVTIKTWFEYDHSDLLMRGFHEVIDQGISRGEVLLSENKYNNLGELIEKNLHVESSIPLQSVDYRYNIRGWLQSINNSRLTIDGNNNDHPDHLKDMFGMELIYNDPIGGIPNN